MAGKSDIATRLGTRRSVLTSIGAALMVVGVLALWWGTQASGEEVESAAGPAVLEPLEGTTIVRVRLTERAAERIGLETTPVREAPGAGGAPPQAVVPYSSVLYDTDGRTWVYTSPEPLAFVRAPIEVERIDGSLAFLSDGPAAGTDVVSVGAALLLGTEFEVDH
ncbi:MAG: hypothetical protein ACRDNI_02260 [Gaiellaceae bacterium]